MADERGIGKCAQNHASSYGYPSRPEEPFPFCSQCGNPMVWSCPECGVSLPEDSAELLVAQYCRHCGTAYFAGSQQARGAADDAG